MIDPRNDVRGAFRLPRPKTTKTLVRDLFYRKRLTMYDSKEAGRSLASLDSAVRTRQPQGSSNASSEQHYSVIGADRFRDGDISSACPTRPRPRGCGLQAFRFGN